MIALVPVSAEVPKFHRPSSLPAIFFVLVLIAAFLETVPAVHEDAEYISNYGTQISGVPAAERDQAFLDYLSKRPLLKYSIAPASWDIERLLYSNFIHGSGTHLGLNLIGVFAGIRILSSFIPFLCSLSVFLLGGSIGLFMSTWFTTSPTSAYIPHVGASAGIFALMGAYAVYNFRYRTTYFFWFPSRKASLVSLKTSWAVFLDVLLLELLLSAAQFMPGRVDNVDHMAHVGGFFSGVVLAFFLRKVQGWPFYLQTRGEFLYWISFLKPRLRREKYDFVMAPYVAWMELLHINPYNDLLKIRLFRLMSKHIDRFNDDEITAAFRYISPTFIRLQEKEVSSFLRVILQKDRYISKDWLLNTPYDSIIRLAKFLASPVHEQHLLLHLVLCYRQVHAENKGMDRKLELLINKLQGIVPKPTGTRRANP